MTLRTSNLIRFTPGPHAAEAADPVARFTLNLAIRLDGVTPWSAASAAGLRALLEIAFAPSGGLCDRAHLVGVTPAGHAPLVLQMAGYWGSTCGYSDPATDVFWVYSDASGDGETLVIDTPCDNLYDCFYWPTAVVAYDPPLEDDDPAPTIALQLDRFVGLDGDPETGVRLPMRLILKQEGVTGETELKALTYEEAPHFTGSGTLISVQKSDDDPDPDGAGLFALTGREIADAVGDVTGDYELYWRIYHGSGDMLYTATCATPDDPATPENEAGSETLPETVRDRRNAGIGGGFGLWATTDLLVARVRVEPEPWPFILETADGLNLPLSGAGEMRPHDAQVLAGRQAWLGTDAAERPIVVTWTEDQVYLAGCAVLVEETTILAAALHIVTDPAPYAAIYPDLTDDDPGWEAIVCLLDDGRVTYRRLRQGDQTSRTLAQQPLPFYDLTWRHPPGRRSYQWSPDACSLLCYAPPINVCDDNTWGFLVETVEIGATEILIECNANEGVNQRIPIALDDGTHREAIALGQFFDGGTPSQPENVRWRSATRPLRRPWLAGTSIRQAYGDHALEYRDAVVDHDFGGAAWVWREVALPDSAWALHQHWVGQSAATVIDTPFDTLDESGGTNCTDSISTHTSGSSLSDTAQVELLVAAFWRGQDPAMRTLLLADSTTQQTTRTAVVTVHFAMVGGNCHRCYEETAIEFDQSTTVVNRATLREDGEDVWSLDLEVGTRTAVAHEYRLVQDEDCPDTPPNRDEEDGAQTYLPRTYLRLPLDPPAPWLDQRLTMTATPDADGFYTWTAGALLVGDQSRALPSGALAVEFFGLSAALYAMPGNEGRRLRQHANAGMTWLESNHVQVVQQAQTPTCIALYACGDPASPRTAVLLNEDLALVGALDDTQIDGIGAITPRACFLAPDPTRVKPATGGCVGGTAPSGPPPTEAELFAAHNAFRSAHDLGPLAQNAELAAAIAAHLAWLKAENAGISATGEDGSEPLDRARAAGYPQNASVGENLALGHTTVALAMAAWEASPAHDANLVRADWCAIGLAILPADSGGYWWGALFGDYTPP